MRDAYPNQLIDYWHSWFFLVLADNTPINQLSRRCQSLSLYRAISLLSLDVIYKTCDNLEQNKLPSIMQWVTGYVCEAKQSHTQQNF
jgi:hypothetical protein